MKNYPSPVEETAQVLLFAQQPAPMMGESPMRPYFLFVIPPVDVPAAKFPCTSRATAPTVPNLSYFFIFGFGLNSASNGFLRFGFEPSWSSTQIYCYFAIFSWLYLSSVKKQLGSTVYKPSYSANQLAPCPESMTCLDFYITFLAAEIGFLILVALATDPALLFFPSIILASSQLTPLEEKTAPFPALNICESSKTRIAVSTASSAVPFSLNIFYPAVKASKSLF